MKLSSRFCGSFTSCNETIIVELLLLHSSFYFSSNVPLHLQYCAIPPVSACRRLLFPSTRGWKEIGDVCTQATSVLCCYIYMYSLALICRLPTSDIVIIIIMTLILFSCSCFIVQKSCLTL